MEILPNNVIFREAESALMKGKQVTIRVVGKSMEPFLTDSKDIAKIAPFISNKLRCGDVVLFKVGEFYCLHRIIQMKKDRITLCGDGICQRVEIISRKNVLGILHSVIRPSGNIVLCNSMYWKIKSGIWVTLFPFRKYILYLNSLRKILKSHIKSK